MTDYSFAAHTEDVSLPCSVRAYSQTYPVLYDDSPRNNPDGTFYPADSFYYLITFSASSTCMGLSTSTLTSYDGIDVESHNMTSWNLIRANWHDMFQVVTKEVDPLEIMTTHPHTDITRFPKHFRVVNYITNDGDPLFSIREDESISKSQQRQLDRLSRNDGYKIDIIHVWDYATSSIRHVHHVPCSKAMLEDPGSVRVQHILTDKYGNSCRVPDMYVDQNSSDTFEDVIRSKCSIIRVYEGCIFGKATISDNIIPTKCLHAELEALGVPKWQFPEDDKCINLTQKMEQKITGLKKTCTKIDNAIKCKNIPIVKTIVIEPKILRPDLNVKLSFEDILDTDRYAARNLDGSYYLWDPITVRHVPDIQWKNHRANTIHFEIQKYNDLNMETSIQCEKNSCMIDLVNPRITTSAYRLGNGDGLTIYNATNDSKLGWQDFTYNITAYNGDIILDNDVKTIGELVALYDPVYSEYPYSVLSDDMRTSYENRAGVALHYFGSLGSGPDDMAGLHEDRRSKINDFYYLGVGFDPWLPVSFNETLSWSAAHPVVISSNQIKHADHNIIRSIHDTTPCEVQAVYTAMLVRAGYCKVYFEYPVIDTVIDASTGPRYENVTLFNTLASNDFAGRQNTYLSNYEYRFTESLLHSNLHVHSVGKNGTINPVMLQVDVSGENYTQSLPEYIHEKVMHDSGDPGLAKIISDDIYPIEYSESGTGKVDVKLRRITSKFPTYQNDLNQNLDDLHIKQLATLYLDNSRTVRLKVPLDVGLGALSPISVIIHAANTTRQYEYPFENFGTNKDVLINLIQDNMLGIKHYDSGTVTVLPPDDFGTISKLYLDGSLVEIPCDDGCNINVPSDVKTHVLAENHWGGRAHATIEEMVKEETPPVPASNAMILVFFALGIPLMYWAYRRITTR